MSANAERLLGSVVGEAGPVTSPYAGYALHGGQSVQVVLPELGRVLGPATLLSPTAVWTLPGADLDALDRERPLRVFLDGAGACIGPLTGELRWNDTLGRGSALGIQLMDVTTQQGRQILSLLEDVLRRGGAEPVSSPLPVQEELSQPERILTVLRSIAAVSNKGVLRQAGRTVRVVLERVDVEKGRLYWHCAGPCAGWGAPPHELEVVGYNSAYRMRVAHSEVEGEWLVTPLPERLWRVRHRWHRRAAAPEGLRARFEHPLWKELGTREREVVDVSYSGLGLSMDAGDLVFPGLFMSVRLDTARGEGIDLSCEVRHVSVSQVTGRRVCGLEARPRTEQDSVRWMELVGQALGPSTRPGAALLEPLWELYQDSGYFHLAGRSPARFEALRRDFVDLGRRMARLPHLWCQTAWPSERGVEASLSSLKAYRYSWMLHQLGRRPGKPAQPPPVPGQILRDVYQRTLEHSQGDADFRWLFSYAESTVPWVERTHLRFARRMQEGGGALVMPVRLMDVSCAEPSGQSAGSLEVGPASIGEKYLLAHEIARTRPAAYVEALDFTRERLELWGVARAWQGAGLERERRILVARRQGVPLAALVLELGQPGANLFRLMDTARLFPLSSRGRDAFVALLDEARRWFSRRGRESFVYLCEDEGDYAPVARLHDDPTVKPMLWILSAALMPEFLEHIHEQSYGRDRSPPDAESSQGGNPWSC